MKPISSVDVTGWNFGTLFPAWHSGSILLEDNGFAFRIGSEWYGAWFEPRYFHAPIISWLAFGLATGLLILPGVLVVS